MTVLLDTNVFLWWIADDPRVSATAGKILRDPASQVLLSAASIWEIAIKAGMGKLRFSAAVDAFIPQQMAANRIDSLPVESRHALGVAGLPHHHRDPFDRILVAQALLENLPLLTTDAQIARYAIQTIW